MKRYLLILTLSISFGSFAQQAPPDSTIEQFCILRVGYYPGKVIINVDFGEEIKRWSMITVKDEKTGEIKKFNSIADGLNYLGRQGWKLVIAVPVIANDTSTTDYIFKKEFAIRTFQ